MATDGVKFDAGRQVCGLCDGLHPLGGHVATFVRGHEGPCQHLCQRARALFVGHVQINLKIRAIVLGHWDLESTSVQIVRDNKLIRLAQPDGGYVVFHHQRLDDGRFVAALVRNDSGLGSGEVPIADAGCSDNVGGAQEQDFSAARIFGVNGVKDHGIVATQLNRSQVVKDFRWGVVNHVDDLHVCVGPAHAIGDGP